MSFVLLTDCGLRGALSSVQDNLTIRDVRAQYFFSQVRHDSRDEMPDSTEMPADFNFECSLHNSAFIETLRMQIQRPTLAEYD